MKYGNFVNKTTIFQTVPTSRRTTQNMATKIIIFFFFTEPKDHTRQKYSQRNLFCILMRFFSSVLAWNWKLFEKKFNHQTFEDNELRLFIRSFDLYQFKYRVFQWNMSKIKEWENNSCFNACAHLFGTPCNHF